ncbi:MAG: FxLYD domain-containing protein [Clostridia bacterium]|nr:FxLYD domain-containing protein [Clostridia bacterium]
MLKFKRFIAVLFAGVTLCLCLCMSACGEDGLGHGFEYVEEPTLYIDYNSYLGYSAEIRGVIKNTSSNDYDYVEIEYTVYDQKGNNIGTALANVNNLGAGETWSFTATLLDFPSSAPESFKLKDITAW